MCRLRESFGREDALHGPRDFGGVDVCEHGRQEGGGGPVAGAQIQHPLAQVIVAQSEQASELLRRYHEHGTPSQQPVTGTIKHTFKSSFFLLLLFITNFCN